MWRLKGFCLFAALFLLATASCRAAPDQEPGDLPALPFGPELQQAIDEVMATNPDHELGISTAVIVPGYQPWRGASGYSQPGVPLTADMIFDAGSVAKNFEAVLALKMVEDNRLALDDPLIKYLPAYPKVDETITIRQLLNHTSGLFNVFEHPDFPWVGADVDYGRRWTEEEVFSTFVLDPYGRPGQVQHYASTNYLLLTAILEEVAGSAVPEQIEQALVEPLHLDHTFVSMGEPPPASYAVAHPWADIDLDGQLDDLEGIPLTWKVTLTHPVIFSTATDLANWMNALYHEGIVLSPASLAAMLSFPEDVLPDPEGARYGLGVVDYSETLGVQALGHGGSSLGYSAAALYLSLIHISEPTRPELVSRMPSSA